MCNEIRSPLPPKQEISRSACRPNGMYEIELLLQSPSVPKMQKCVIICDLQWYAPCAQTRVRVKSAMGTDFST